jgi:TM2 domain-containing membrane protein YozV
MEMKVPDKHCPKCGCRSLGIPSEKSLSVAALLCLFFGGLGLHRFYMNKYATGVMMLCSLGGLGIWSLIDLIWILSGKFKDKRGLPINYTGDLGRKPAVIIIIVAFFCGFVVLGVLASISLPEYARLSAEIRDRMATEAGLSASSAQDVFYVRYGRYAETYEDLEKETSFRRKDSIEYGPIEIYYPPPGSEESTCFRLATRSKEGARVEHAYEDCS